MPEAPSPHLDRSVVRYKSAPSREGALSREIGNELRADRAKADAIGLSYRTETADLFDASDLPSRLRICEVHAEDRRLNGPALERVRDLRRDGCDVYLHSTALNFLSDDFMADGAAMNAIVRLAESIGASLISGHLAADEGYVGLIRAFDRPAYSPGQADRVLERMANARSRFGLPVAVENIAYYGSYLADEIDEIDFINRIAADDDAEIIFDISNHMTNRTNASCGCGDIDALAIERVKYVHISGGKWLENIYVDTHGDLIPSSHIEQLRRLRNRGSPLSVLYERDIRFERREEIRADLGQIWNSIHY